ncbi:MAG: hypothetical protein U9M98_01390 [Patescibacteria group bacterium]|nr:hypothetical protein [Patescibacteria group bacterium]
MKNILIILSTILIAFAIFFYASPKELYAGSAIQLTPTSLEFELESGGTFMSQDFNLFNPSKEETQEVTVKVSDFFVDDETGSYRILKELHPRYSLSEWVSVEPKKVTLEPLEVQNLTVTFTSPQSAEPGGHYAMLIIDSRESDSEQEVEGVLVQPVGGVAAPLFATVPGDISWEGRLLEFLPVSFKNTGPVEFKLRFQNQGTVHYRPSGKVEVFDFLNNKVGEAKIRPTRVFPQSIRRLETTWDRYLLIGKYRAKATLTYGEPGSEETETAKITFWAFPYKPAAVILITIIIVILVTKLKKQTEEEASS